MGKLLLLGAGHAHLTTIAHIQQLLQRGHDVTVVSPSERHFYSGMGPGLLGGTYTPEQTSFPVRQLVEQAGGTYVIDCAVRIDAPAKKVVLQSGDCLSYDVCSCNTGSTVAQISDTPPMESVYPVKPIEELFSARQHILHHIANAPISIVILGGGPAALEVACNAAMIAPPSQGHRITMIAGSSFMQHFPGRVRNLCLEELYRLGIHVQQDMRAVSYRTKYVLLSDGQALEPDILFIATGVSPSRLFKDSGLPSGPDGGLAVDRYLCSPKYPSLLGGGDCIYFVEHPLAKVGVYALRANQTLYHNICAMLEGSPLIPFSHGGEYLLVFNTGNGRGVLHKRGFSYAGKSAFWIKDWIDRRFMRKFKPKNEVI